MRDKAEDIIRAWHAAGSPVESIVGYLYEHDYRKADGTPWLAKDIRALLDIEPPPDANGWIGVEDRLPGAGVSVLGWGRQDSTAQEVFVCSLGMTAVGHWFDRNIRAVWVTHWQPLPAGPVTSSGLVAGEGGEG